MNKILKKLIDKSDVISFDIFDTLIKRNCLKPTDVFKFVEIKYNNLNKNKISNFAFYRIEAEKKSREKVKNSETTLNDIYNCIDIFDNKTKEELKKIETETEYNFCQKNYKMFEVYKYCLEKNKKIICVSDMYLPREVIEKILKENDYNVNKIYISCEHQTSKFHGGLYKVVLSDLNILPNKILHIGDSKRADILSAIKNGIKCYYIKRENKYNKYIKLDKINESNLSDNLIYSLLNNNCNKIDNYYERLGYEILGPICCSFVYWVNKMSNKLDINNLLFCARDMEMIQQIYNIIFDNKEKINNNYFYISRKSSFLPFLYINNKFDDFLSLMPEGKRKVSINELLLSFNISVDHLEDKLNKYNLSYNETYDLNDLRKDKRFKELYEKEIKKIILKEGKIQYDNLMKYLEKCNISNKTAIVDLGWHGTTQRILIKILKYNIQGLYLGLYGRDNKIITKKNCFTQIFDEDSKLYSNEIFSFLTLFEILFSALHGSTSSYTDDDNCPYVLDEPQNKDNKYINLIQSGAITFANDFKEYSEYFDEIDFNVYINELIRIGISPNLKEAKNLGNINTENLKIRKLAEPRNILNYIFNIKNFKNDFTNAEWKIAFMKRLLKIKLPYYKLYFNLKKIRDRK